MALEKSKKRFGLYEIIGTLILICSVIVVRQGVLGISIMGSVIFPMFLQAIVVALAMYMAGYIRFRIGDYILIALLVFLTKAIWSISFLYLLILIYGLLILMYIFIYIRYKSVLQKSVECFLIVIEGLIGYAMYELLYNVILLKIYNYCLLRFDFNNILKMLFLIFEAVFSFIIIAALLVGMKKIFEKYFTRINEISMNNKEISWYMLSIPWILGLMIWIVFRFDGAVYYIPPEKLSRGVVIAAVVLVFAMQLVYIRILVKTVQLREHLMREQYEKNTMEVYNSNLAKNIEEIRGIKHDVKNMFLTMGEFVDRSDDAEMKEYYQERIVPFASKEFKMNDLYAGLQDIHNESLRAFLYYKLMQGLSSEVNMHLNVVMDKNHRINYDNLPDMIRILGIFIDNGIEEAVLTDEKDVYVEIREQDKTMSIAVKNSVRDMVKEKGISKGTTTKGLGRGQGLDIAGRIVDKYDDLLWNSYFQDGMYVQVIISEI